MKKLLYILLIASGCVKEQSISRCIRVASSTLFIINGDSNSGGIASNDSALVGEKGIRINAKIINNHTNQFETLNIGVNNNLGVGILDSANRHGIELGLTNSVDSGRFLQPAYIVKTGYSGAKVSTLSTTYWANLNKRIDSARAYLTRNNIRYEMYMFFTGGGNDANAHIDSATFKTNLKAYFTSIRTKHGRMPIFMPYVPLKGSLDSALVLKYNIVIGYLENEIPDFYPLQSNDCYTKIGAHFEYSGFKILASRMVATLKSKYKVQLCKN